MAQTQLSRPARIKSAVSLRVLLAALPFVGIYSGGTLAAHIPMLFGVPFLLVWNLIWMAGTAAILALIYLLDSRDEAARAHGKTAGEP
ncbi:MAG: DUF3311 domain-containing protein [Paraburkholderia sp.]|jgi:hypothetical protein|nr:DUF3311 domain-containing protein [Paraburkholderia sp.]